MRIAIPALLLLSSCGRNWCVGGVGPCDQYNNMDPKQAAQLQQQQQQQADRGCGYQKSGNPRNGLTIHYTLSTPTYPMAQTVVTVSGGTPPYKEVGGNGLYTLTPLASDANGTRSWTFRAGLVPGFACFKIVDATMGRDDQCDACSAEIRIAPTPR